MTDDEIEEEYWKELEETLKRQKENQDVIENYSEQYL